MLTTEERIAQQKDWQDNVCGPIIDKFSINYNEIVMSVSRGETTAMEGMSKVKKTLEFDMELAVKAMPTALKDIMLAEFISRAISEQMIKVQLRGLIK